MSWRGRSCPLRLLRCPHLTQSKELRRQHASDVVQSGFNVAPSQSFQRWCVVRVWSNPSPSSSSVAPAQTSRRCCVVRKAISPIRLLRSPPPAKPKILCCPGRRRPSPSEAFAQSLCSPIFNPTKPKPQRRLRRRGPSTLLLLLEVHPGSDGRC